MTITLNPVTSTNLAAIGHDPDTNTLAVQFKPRVGEAVGDTWHYAGVSADKHQALLKAESVGKYFSTHIKPKHSAKKISNKP
jgi:hypothetical protein